MTTTGDWRPLALKRDGTCVECHAPLAAGVTASWSRARRAVRCLVHDAPMPPADLVVAPAAQESPSAGGIVPAADEEHAVPSVVPPASGPAVQDDDWRPLVLKRAGVCAACRAELPAGATASWSRSRKAVRCLGHDADASVGTLPALRPEPDEAPAAEPATPDPAVPRASGTAGGSALAEYERRAARREQRIRSNHPVLGGLILALSDEPQHVRAWKVGAAGERAVGRRLDELVAHGVEVMHDRRIPRSKANIDHIAVSPSGIYVIDAKNYTGMVKVDWEGGLFSPRRYKLLVGRRDCTKLVVGVERQVELVRAALEAAPGLPADVPVVGVLAFFDAEWPLLFPPDHINAVRLEGPRSTRDLIRRPGPLTSEQVAAVAAHLRRSFPDAAPAGTG